MLLMQPHSSRLLTHRLGDLETRKSNTLNSDALTHRIGDLEKYLRFRYKRLSLTHRIGDLEIDCYRFAE